MQDIFIPTVVWRDGFANVLVRSDARSKHWYVVERGASRFPFKGKLTAIANAKLEVETSRRAVLKAIGEPIRRVILTPYQKGKGPSFSLTLWDADGLDRPSGDNGLRYRVAYRLTQREGEKRKVLFEGFATCALGWTQDGDKTVRAVLEDLCMRIGDTDREFFDDYTQAQLDFADAHAEALGCEASYRFPTAAEKAEQKAIHKQQHEGASL